MHLLTDSSANKLVLAINHFLSIGDHVGEGIGLETDGKLMILIPVNTLMSQDREDFNSFLARFNQIKEEFSIELEPQGQHGIMETYSLTIEKSLISAVADRLIEEPGPLGWGSTKAKVDLRNQRLGG